MGPRGIGVFAAACAAVTAACDLGVDGGASPDAGPASVTPPTVTTDAGAPRDARPGGSAPRGLPTAHANLDGGPTLSADASTPPAVGEVPDPPPLSGGTLALSSDGRVAVASDPDEDRVLVVDLATRGVRAVALDPRDEPGRVAIDGAGRAHVALRRGGALVTIDLSSASVRSRRRACALPRGVAWDPETDDVHVVCASGELVSFAAAGGDATRRVFVEPDLRDVVAQGDRLIVTRFRSAETLVIDRAGAVTQRHAAPVRSGEEAGVAWRAVAAPGGGAWVLHQRYGEGEVQLSSGGYNSAPVFDCSGAAGIVRPGLARVRPPIAPTRGFTLPDAPLAVDVAVDRSGSLVAFAVPGNAGGSRAQVRVSQLGSDPCAGNDRPVALPLGQAVAVAFTPSGALVTQTRAPSRLYTADGFIELGGVGHAHPGHLAFHTNTEGRVTCASCHAEGDDDGRAWRFASLGALRTQYLRGGLLGTEPFHWSGDQSDFAALVDEVLVRRMGAPRPEPAVAASLAGWIDRLPTLPRGEVDAERAARGEAVFRDAATNCAGCHSGPRFSNGESVDVGTGGRFQVPTLLGLRWRAPYLHDGRAATLRDRFGAQGGGEMHGHTAHLTPAQVDDLIAYLESL